MEVELEEKKKRSKKIKKRKKNSLGDRLDRGPEKGGMKNGSKENGSVIYSEKAGFIELMVGKVLYI